MPTNDDNVTSFIEFFNAHDEAGLMTLFCADDPLNPIPPALPDFPCAGITDHGPAFYGRTAVQSLFHQMFTTFQNLDWVEYVVPSVGLNAPRLSWTGPPNIGNTTGEIGVQLTFQGKYHADWFRPPSNHVSKPLSQLHNYTHGRPLGRQRGDQSGLPAFAVFSFDSNHNIRQLQMYLDRYAMMQSITLQPGHWGPDN